MFSGNFHIKVVMLQNHRLGLLQKFISKLNKKRQASIVSKGTLFDIIFKFRMN